VKEVLVQVSKKLNMEEFAGLLHTSTYENMISNKLHIFCSKRADDDLWELLKHFEEYAEGVFHMTTLGSDNIWRLYFESTHDRNKFLDLITSSAKDTEQTPIIESVVVNTTHDTE
tara:strand:- start:4628 stop:4972 length:345 start_codon:yes stop_codon:yes gene_type:complete